MNFSQFKKQFQKKEVEHFPHRVGPNPTISIIVVAYQHKNYIQDCLQSILSQKTNFEFEIIIGEDSSSDGTREECIKLAKKYPERIRLFLHHRANNIKIAGRPTGRFNGLYSFYVSNGKYIAICEGDDFWTDPLKLQKQVDYLEKNRACRLVSHNMSEINESLKSERKIESKFTELYFSDFALRGCRGIYTCSMLFRNEDWLRNAIFNKGVVKFDGLDHIILLAATQGGRKVHILDDYMASYRIHEGGVWSSGNKKTQSLFNIKNYKLYIEHVNFAISDKQKLKLMLTRAISWLMRNTDSEKEVGFFRKSWAKFFESIIYSNKNSIKLKLLLIDVLLIIYQKRINNFLKENN